MLDEDHDLVDVDGMMHSGRHGTAGGHRGDVLKQRTGQGREGQSAQMIGRQ